LLPPAGQVTPAHAGLLEAEVGIGRQPEQLLKAGDLGLLGLRLLGLEFITGVDMAEFARRFDEFVFRMRAVGPEILQIANIGSRDLNRRLQFEERHPQE